MRRGTCTCVIKYQQEKSRFIDLGSFTNTKLFRFEKSKLSVGIAQFITHD